MILIVGYGIFCFYYRMRIKHDANNHLEDVLKDPLVSNKRPIDSLDKISCSPAYDNIDRRSILSSLHLIRSKSFKPSSGRFLVFPQAYGHRCRFSSFVGVRANKTLKTILCYLTSKTRCERTIFTISMH